MKKSKKVFIGLLSVFLIVLLILIMLPQYFKIFGVPNINIGKYTKEHLDNVVGVELRESDYNFGKIKCTRYWNNRNTPTEFDELRFYVFDSSSDAKKAFKNIKKSAFDEIEKNEDNYVKGHLADTVDASVTRMYFLDKNLIITTDLECYSEWAVNPDDPEDGKPFIQNEEEVLALIKRITN